MGLNKWIFTFDERAKQLYLDFINPLKSKKAIATFSPGVGIMTSIFNFRIGAFLGTDLVVGETAKSWDSYKKPWIGFGLSYNIGFIWGTGK